MRQWLALVAASASAVAVAGCGSSGTVVSAPAARQAIAHSGFRIHWRKGPTPTPFIASLYGTATGAQGVSVNFGFLFSGNADAGGLSAPSMNSLVPHATQEGTTVRASFVLATSAGSSHRPPTGKYVREEFRIFDLLSDNVGRLAPVASADESG